MVPSEPVVPSVEAPFPKLPPTPKTSSRVTPPPPPESVVVEVEGEGTATVVD